MSQRPPNGPRGPKRASRRRSVLGPPSGSETGTGYVSPPGSPTDDQFPHQQPINRKPVAASSSPAAGPSTMSRPDSGRRRPDPEIFDPIQEIPPRPPSPRGRGRRRDPTSINSPTVMFYPSSTTLSSMDSDLLMEPMPFFRTDLRMQADAVEQRGSMPTAAEELGDPTRSVSMASSGALGPGTVEVDLDTESDDDGSITTDSSGYEQLVRTISLVRRGQARLMRNPSARQSMTPEIRSTPSTSSGPPTSTSTDHRLGSPASLEPPVAYPPQMPPSEPPRALRRTSRLAISTPIPGGSQTPSPVILNPRPPSSIYGDAPSGPPSTSTSPIPKSPRFYGPKGPVSLFPRKTTPSPTPPILTGRQKTPSPARESRPLAVYPLFKGRQSQTPSPAGSNSSLANSDTSVARGRPRPPPLNMAAIMESEKRGSLTSLPDLMDRATKLYEVLATGKTASMLVDGSRGSRSDIEKEIESSPSVGDMLATFPPRNTPPQSGLRGSWPLATFPLLRPKQRRPGESPLRRTPIGNDEIGRQSVKNTPLPQRPEKKGFFRTLFPKFDPNDTTPTGPLFPSPDGYQKERLPGRRCCGLPFWTILIIVIVIALIIAAVIAVPILVLRQRKSSADLTVQQCEIDQPCQNNGASILVNNPPQCACLCASGFSGSTCQSLDNSCATISSIKGGPTNTSIGSAVAPLINIARSEFSNQFNLSAQRIVEQFAASNISCTSQNSLVNLNGSTSAAVPVLNAMEAQTVVMYRVPALTTSITTITLTFTSTVPFVVTSESATWTVFGPTPTTSITTSEVEMSTYSISASTMFPGPTSVGGIGGLSDQSLVFGRCAILAIVQDFGVSPAAAFQQLLESAILKREDTVKDTSIGITIDLATLAVSGLPSNG